MRLPVSICELMILDLFQTDQSFFISDYVVGPTCRNICETHGINRLILGYLLRLKHKRFRIIYILYVHSEDRYYTCNRAGEKIGDESYESARKSIMDQKCEIFKKVKVPGESCVKNLFLFNGMHFNVFIRHSKCLFLDCACAAEI